MSPDPSSHKSDYPLPQDSGDNASATMNSTLNAMQYLTPRMTECTQLPAEDAGTLQAVLEAPGPSEGDSGQEDDTDLANPLASTTATYHLDHYGQPRQSPCASCGCRHIADTLVQARWETRRPRRLGEECLLCSSRNSHTFHHRHSTNLVVRTI